MSTAVLNTLLAALGEFVAGETGLFLSKEQRRNLVKALGFAARDFGFDDEAACAQWLISPEPTREQFETFVSHLTVGETYFFRDAKTFEALEADFLRQLIDSRAKNCRRLRIWSAGCATGEEPYSIAILLCKMIPDLKNWGVAILATDINKHFLSRAQTGVYGKWSFRETPAWVREGYFQNTGEDRFELAPAVKSMVSFGLLNLAKDDYPSPEFKNGDQDIILCRNTLMYFTPAAQKKIIQNFGRCLVEGGLLIVGPSEISNDLFPQFTPVDFCGATFYKKEASRALAETQPGRTGQRRAFPSGSCGPFSLVSKRPLEPVTAIIFPEKGAGPPAVAPKKAPDDGALPEAYKDAAALYGKGCYDEAAEKAKARLSESPNDGRAMLLLAMVYADQGLLSDALLWSEQAIASEKTNPQAHYLRGIILEEAGRIEEAVQSFKRSLYLDPDFILAYFALGNLLRRQTRRDESERCYKNALSLLRRRKKEDVLAASSGLTAGRLIEMIQTTLRRSGHDE